MVLLDTNICAYFMSRKYPSVTAQFRACDPQSLCVSALVAGELAYGVELSTRVESNRINLNAFLSMLRIVAWDEQAMWHFGQQKGRLKKAGTPIGEIDLLIGCQALALGATMVTNNTREFERIEGLKLENWALPSAAA
jgi:tRNA(fMet)-specific endonuclease VapC